MTGSARLALRIDEVAEQLGVGRSTVKRWCASGELPCIRPGGVVLIEPEDLRAFLDQHKQGRPPSRPARLRAARSA